jgi:tRNA U34 5-methylaminomethyl-2-thiouridine-forming methyltransferase MnmC
MPRQLTDEEFNFLQARRQVADFVESIYNDPQLNREAKALIKKKYPNLQIPDYDIESKLESRLNKEKEEREAERERQRRADEDAKFAKMRKQTQDKHGFTDDAMARLEQLMIDRNIGDYEAGAMLLASKEPKPMDAGGQHDGFWHVDKQKGFEEIAKDPEAWGRAEIMRAIHTDQERERNG